MEALVFLLAVLAIMELLVTLALKVVGVVQVGRPML